VSSLSSNPFATRFISPGQVDWVGADDYFEQLASHWLKLNCRASIIGVHGSGKSTLLEHYVPLIGDVIFRRDAEGNVIENRSSGASGRERCPAIWLQVRKTVPESTAIPWGELRRGRLLVLDGFEQLSRWRRAALIARTGLRNVKLLVTSHRRTMLPTLCELSITPSLALQIVSQLTTGRGDLATISDEVVQRSLQKHGGNMREVLMQLYDRVEEQRVVGMQKVKPKS
jgi:hypothetical protein